MEARSWRSRLAVVGASLAGIAAFVVVGLGLEQELGIRFDTTYRVACAAICLYFIVRIASAYPGERWPWIGFSLALLVDLAMFFTPLLAGRASRGEVMLFALPDAVIMLVARIVTYRVVDEHQRAVRQQLVLGLVVATAFCVLLLGLELLWPDDVRRRPPRPSPPNIGRMEPRSPSGSRAGASAGPLPMTDLTMSKTPGLQPGRLEPRSTQAEAESRIL